MLRRRGLVLLSAGVLALAVVCGCGLTGEPAEEPAEQPSATAILTITPTGMTTVDAVSTDARWLVGSEPRDEGASRPKPLVRLDRGTGEQTVLCDWADESLGYCSLAEQGGIIPERPELLLELVDDNAVRGWFPSGGVFLVDTASGERTRIDVAETGEPLRPGWEAARCGGQCDYHETPRLHITTDGVSGDGRMAAFCANYEEPRQPILYVKDLDTGVLTRTTVPCGVLRFGREDDDDEFADEAMVYPEISADGSVVHVSGEQSTGGEYGLLGWAHDTLYFPASGEAREVPGSGSMTRDGATLFLRGGEQTEMAEADVVVDYVAYAVGSGSVTPLPWMRDFLASAGQPAPVLGTFAHASDDGRLVLNATVVRDVSTGAQADIASQLRERGYTPTAERGWLRVSGDGSTILADVVAGDPLAESSNRVVLVTGWGWGQTG